MPWWKLFQFFENWQTLRHGEVLFSVRRDTDGSCGGAVGGDKHPTYLKDKSNHRIILNCGSIFRPVVCSFIPPTIYILFPLEFIFFPSCVHHSTLFHFKSIANTVRIREKKMCQTSLKAAVFVHSFLFSSYLSVSI